jgi:16S rRNA pseudouridine516 synthase
MGSADSKKPKKMRLDAYLARAGLASRREARGLIRRGAVSVDAEICHDPGRQIAEEVVRLDSERVDSPAEVRDFVLHKPVGFACSDDEREAPLVRDLLSEALRRRSLRIAGRLDRATSGLLVLTSDGDFVHRLTHPTRKVPKRYRIDYQGDLAQDAVERCAAGLLLHGDERPTRPAELELSESRRATLILREGRTHQVRRMMRVLGAEVVALHRDRVGDFELPADLEVGSLRALAPRERALLLSDSSL